MGGKDTFEDRNKHEGRGEMEALGWIYVFEVARQPHV